MPIAELFLNLYNYKSAEKADFTELDLSELEAIAQLFPLNFDETGAQIKAILEKRYTDGISGFESVRVEGNKILGVFYDIVSPALRKKFDFSINTESGDVDYTQIDTGNLGQSFSEYEFAAKKGKSKQCAPGKSSACKRTDGSVYCIKVGFKCKSVGLSEDEKVVAAAIIKKKKGEKVASKKPQEPTSPPQKKASAPERYSLQNSKFSSKTSQEIRGLMSEAAKLRSKKDSLQLQVNSSMMFEISQLANKDNFLGIKDSKGNLQAASIINLKNDHIYIDYLATAPWNIVEKDKRKVKGAGTAAIEAIVRKSIEQGMKGKVKLESLPGAISFYEKIGFKQTGTSPDSAEGVVKMELSPEKAILFLDKVKRE